MSKNNNMGLNLDDFKIENVFDKDYEPQGLINIPETDKIEEPEEVEEPEVITPPKGVEKQKKVKDEEPEEEVDVEDEDEIDPDEMPAPDGNEIDFKPFYNLFHEKLGWEVDENDMPENSVEGLIEYMNNIVENASKPQYANELSEKFDKFLANGGDPQKFINTMFKPQDYSTFEIKSDEDKKAVLKEHLTRTNPDKGKDWIDRKVSRYEDSGVLDEEAEDALEVLKQWDSEEKETIVAKQEAAKLKEVEDYKAQIENLKTTLLNKKEIAKIPVTQREMQDFFTFLAVPEKDGKTKYQKVTMANQEAAIISAYIAYKGFDVTNLNKNVRSDVVKDLKRSLSKYSSSNTGLNSKTSIPVSSNKTDYSQFDIKL